MIGTRPEVFDMTGTLTVWLSVFPFMDSKLLTLVQPQTIKTLFIYCCFVRSSSCKPDKTGLAAHHWPPQIPPPSQVHVWPSTRCFSLSAIVLSSWHATLPHEWEEAWLKWKVLCTSAAKFSWTHCLGRNVMLWLCQQFSQYCMLERMDKWISFLFKLFPLR